MYGGLMFYLYTITNTLDSNIYVGQTVKPKERWSQHKAYARNEKPIQYIHRAMAKHGVDNFVCEVVAICRTQEDADEVETQLIRQYGSLDKNKGYNLSPGGDIAWNRGLPKELQPMHGRQHSKKTKKQISLSNVGITKPEHTEEWKDFMSSKMTGREITWSQKISEAQTKFNPDKERKIVLEYERGATPKILGEKYDCSARTIYNIIERRKKYDS
ncbi:MAG: GIY-YIG nuclease family protein [Nitrosotalea sp.]